MLENLAFDSVAFSKFIALWRKNPVLESKFMKTLSNTVEIPFQACPG